MTECILTMKTSTGSERARRIASQMRIPAQVVSLDPGVTRYGCAYGLRFPCGETGRLRTALDRAQIPYGTLIGAAR